MTLAMMRTTVMTVTMSKDLHTQLPQVSHQRPQQTPKMDRRLH